MDIPKEVYRAIDSSMEEYSGPFPLSLIQPILTGPSFVSDQRVGTFGPESDGDDDGDNASGWSVIAGLAIGIIFGSIHCTAWQFQFPSYIEQLLWRISAISVTSGPFLMALFGALGAIWEDDIWEILSAIASALVTILRSEEHTSELQSRP